MLIRHEVGGLATQKRILSNDVGFMLSNNKGNYMYLGASPTSRYQGIYFFNQKSASMRKVIEDIAIVDDKTLKPQPISKITRTLYGTSRKRGDVKEAFLLPHSHNAVLYALNKQAPIMITLDGKESYDNREYGRYYSFSEQDGIILIKFTKKTDFREDASTDKEEYSHYVALKADTNDYFKIDSWTKRDLTTDQKRNSPPFIRYVYQALKINASHLVCTFSESKEECLKECRELYKNFVQMMKKHDKLEHRFLTLSHIKKVMENEEIKIPVKIAYAHANYALYSLCVEHKNKPFVFAGLPWFFQNWSRDTLVSLKALNLTKQVKVQELLTFYIKSIQPNGRLPNILNKTDAHESADSIGWLVKRLSDTAQPKLRKDTKTIKQLKKGLEHLEKHFVKDGFYINGPCQTWMDTVYNNDTRAGVRIETQAMLLAYYDLLYKLTKETEYSMQLTNIKDNIRKHFWNNKTIADGKDDYTVRPNVFLAAYIYPELLTDIEWIKAFKNMLPSLWLSWGGLASIDKKHHLFSSKSTGQDVKSYHRGDSWYWVNNLAALVLQRLTKKSSKATFNKYIQKILKASTNEILWSGAVGTHAEVSDAYKMVSGGCINQAWSNALFVELVNEL